MDDASQGQDPDRAVELSGRQLGDYRLLRRLGRGGMAEVYLAQQISLDRRVAFKVLKSTLSRDGNYVRRFQQEARAAASLVHANIVQIYEVGFLQGRHFIAQEYVAGGTLRQWMSTHRMCEPSRVVAVIRQVAAALHCASQQQVIHRDIKPENILLSKRGEAKVADFGLARLAAGGATEDLRLTQQGSTMGTPLYMSPEQIEGRDVDPRSDLYSLGVTAYEMLVGQPPFRGETALNVAVQHLGTQAERLEQIRDDVSIGLCCVVHKLLSKEPAERYDSAAELQQALHSAMPQDYHGEWQFADGEDAEHLTLENSHLGPTRRLDGLMKAEGQRLTTRRTGWVIALSTLCGVAAGVIWAYVSVPAPLLDVPVSTLARVEKKESARLQYLHAILEPSQPSWQAVVDYFGLEQQAENRQYVFKAKAELARIFLDRGLREKALTLYGELADVGEDFIEQRALGLVGMANLYQRQGDQQALSLTLSRLAVDLEKLGPRRLAITRELDSQLKTRMSRFRNEQRRGRKTKRDPAARPLRRIAK